MLSTDDSADDKSKKKTKKEIDKGEDTILYLSGITSPFLDKTFKDMLKNCENIIVLEDGIYAIYPNVLSGGGNDKKQKIIASLKTAFTSAHATSSISTIKEINDHIISVLRENGEKIDSDDGMETSSIWQQYLLRIYDNDKDKIDATINVCSAHKFTEEDIANKEFYIKLKGLLDSAKYVEDIFRSINNQKELFSNKSVLKFIDTTKTVKYAFQSEKLADRFSELLKKFFIPDEAGKKTGDKASKETGDEADKKQLSLVITMLSNSQRDVRALQLFLTITLNKAIEDIQSSLNEVIEIIIKLLDMCDTLYNYIETLDKEEDKAPLKDIFREFYKKIVEIWDIVSVHIDYYLGFGFQINKSIMLLKSLFDNESLNRIFRFFTDQEIAFLIFTKENFDQGIDSCNETIKSFNKKYEDVFKKQTESKSKKKNINHF